MTSRYFVPALPTLSPAMLLPRWSEGRRGQLDRTFPFNAPHVRYFYFARNALWEACRLMELAGGEVIVPAYHHGVEIETLVAAGVRPVFYPVGRQWDVDLDGVERLIGPNTRALYMIHYAGFPGPASEMKAIADRHGLPLIEDCALSLLARDGRAPVGGTGDVAFFSIYKMLPVPNGGAMALSGSLAERSRSLGAPQPPPLTSTWSHLLSSLLQHVEMRGGHIGRQVRRVVRRLGRRTVENAGIQRVTTGSDHFGRGDANLGMSGISMRILAGQDMEQVVRSRRRNYSYLLERLSDVAPPVVPTLPLGACPLFYPTAVRDKAGAVARLETLGIQAIDFWRLFHPSCDPARFPDVAWLRHNVLELPCHQDLTPPMMAYIARCVRQLLRTE